MKILLSILSVLFCSILYAQTFDPVDTTQSTVKVSASVSFPMLIHLPNDYNSTSTQYPLLIFCHGAGEAGGPAVKIYNNNTAGGPAYFIAHGQWPSSFVDNKTSSTFKFIVISPYIPNGGGGLPPSYTGSINETMIDFAITDMIARYRIDTSRIYLTGLSAGGQGVMNYCGRITENGPAVPFLPSHSIAAFSPMSATSFSGFANQIADTVFKYKIGAMPAGSPQQDTYGDNMGNFGARLNADSAGYVYSSTSAYNGQLYYMYTWTGGHCCWNQLYNPTATFTWRGSTDNLYQFLLYYTKGATNVQTQCNAGTDQTITTTSTTLAGSAQAGTGRTIVSNTWTQISGPNTGTITSIHSYTSTLTGLIVGTYVFRLTVIDDNSTTVTDDMQITVNNPALIPPTVGAGQDQTILLNPGTTTLTGSASANGGATLTSTTWTQINGPSAAVIVSPTTVTTGLTGLIQGVYTFRLTAIDNNNSTSSDDVQITVILNCNGVRRYVTLGGDGGVIIHGTTFVYNPGDTIMIRSSQAITYFYMQNFHGSPGCNVVVSNEGGRVTMSTGFAIDSCSYIEIVGRDTANTGLYGIKAIQGVTKSPELQIQSLSHDIHAHNLELTQGLYGVVCKNEISCDTTINYPLGTILHIELDHLWIHNMNQEGMYLGSTDPAGTTRTITCGGIVKQYIPTPLGYISVHDNVVDSTNRSSIQLSGAAIGQNYIYNNTCTHAGYEYNGTQGANIWLGSMTANTYVYGNTMRGSYLGNFQSYGIDSAYVHDNTMDSAGLLVDGNGVLHTNVGQPNILIDTRTTYPVNTVFTSFYLQNNVLGATSTSPRFNITVLKTHAVYNADNKICTNTLLGGGTVNISVVSGIVYSTNCPLPAVNVNGLLCNNCVFK